MSADFSNNHANTWNSGPLPINRRTPFGGEDRTRPRGQVLRSMMQQGSSTSPRGMAARDNPRMSPNGQTWQNNEQALAFSSPLSQHPTEHSMSSERQTTLTPTSSVPSVRSPGSYEARMEKLSSHSSNRHLRTPSQQDNLSQENAKLREELEELGDLRERTQAACDRMLTELMTTQESLDERQTAIEAKDAELLNLREQLARRSREPQGGLPDALRAGESLSLDDQRELRDLRLRCSRLQKEAQRKDEQIEQLESRADTLEAKASRNPRGPRDCGVSQAHQQRLAEAEQRAADAIMLHQYAQEQVDLYLSQIMEWKTAYDGLKASHDHVQQSNLDLQERNSKLERSHSEMTRAAHENRSRADDQTTQQLQSVHIALDEARKMMDFFKQNSERLSRTNKDVTDRVRGLEDALQSRSREVDQQKTMIDALQRQMN